MSPLKQSKSNRGTKHYLQTLLVELNRLRSQLRETLRAYSARLEIGLAEAANGIAALKEKKNISQERLRQLEGLARSCRDVNLKPEKGRRKDLRKVEKLIKDLHAAVRSGLSR